MNTLPMSIYFRHQMLARGPSKGLSASKIAYLLKSNHYHGNSDLLTQLREQYISLTFFMRSYPKIFRIIPDEALFGNFQTILVPDYEAYLSTALTATTVPNTSKFCCVISLCVL